MKEILVIGTGYVGLITGVSLAEIGNNVICLDIDEDKIKTLQNGKTPIYEPGLVDYLKRNIENNRLNFTTEYKEAVEKSEIIYLALGTPENEDGSANLTFLFNAVKEIMKHINNDKIIVIKSTVPVGTSLKVKELVNGTTYSVKVVSNPEFLREGSALHDAFNGDRIVIGSDDKEALEVIENLNKSFGLEIFTTENESAEMIKYASNAFLATKISFINEMANICERVGADVTEVAKGMGMDERIGNKFLNAGIGYGGSCFPKDTKALSFLAKEQGFNPLILNSVIERNDLQKLSLIEKYDQFSNLKDEAIGILGFSFKPNTDDLREAASISIIDELIKRGKKIYGYDPISGSIVKEKMSDKVTVLNSADEVLEKTKVIFLVTEWDEFKQLDFSNTNEIFDGRNLLDVNLLPSNIKYYRIGKK